MKWIKVSDNFDTKSILDRVIITEISEDGRQARQWGPNCDVWKGFIEADGKVYTWFKLKD